MGKGMSKKLTMLVAATVLMGHMVSVAQPVFANNLSNTKVEDKVIREEYINNFDGQTSSQWKTIQGKGSVTETEDGWLEVKRESGSTKFFTIFDENSPQLSNGEVEIKFKVSADGRFGIVTRPSNDNSYLFMGYDIGGQWKIVGSDGGEERTQKNFTGPVLIENQEYVLKVGFQDKHITMTLDGVEIFNETVNMNIPTGQGYGIGFHAWQSNLPSYVDYIRASEGTLGDLKAKEIASVEEVNVSTFAKVKPVMPTTVKVTYADGTTGAETVRWDYISKDKYSTPGNVELTGIIRRKDTEDVAVKANLEVRSKPLKYSLDFETEENSGQWETAMGTANAELADGKINLKMQGGSTIADVNAPNIANGTLEADFTTSVDSGRAGLVFRYVDDQNYSAICQDNGNWIWKNFTDGKASYGSFGKSTLALAPNTTYKMKLSFEETKIKLEVDGEVIGEQSIGAIPVVQGKYGVHSWFESKTVSLDNVNFNEKGEFNDADVPDELPLEEKYIESDSMKVTLDNRFPSIREYVWKDGGDVLLGEEEQLFQVELNGIKHKPKVEFKQIDTRTAQYDLNFEQLGVNIKLDMSLSKDNVVRMEFKEINETGEYKVKTIAFPEHSLASVKDIDGGKTSTVLTTGDWNNIKEEFKTVDELKNGNYSKTYAIINDDKFAIAINNNIVEGGNKFVLGAQDRDGYRKASLSNGTFIYREDSINGVEQIEAMPWSEIMIARDENTDKEVDWQDAAILYRNNMEEVKFGSYIKDSFSYIPFNIGSLAQSPFLRTADQVKKLSNYTDGFGQLVLEKGYQGEGHDDVIADIGGHTGIRPGGAADLNKLIEIGKEYNAKVGVHVNVTEYHLDANELKVENLKPGFQKGWGWKDQSYYVDQRKDITTGELQRRFEMLKQDHPELAWIYVDVYTGNGWNAQQLADTINNHDWMLATEFNGPLEQQTAWTHWGGDPAYPNRGNESKIIRFIRNQEQDVYMADDMLKGAKHMLSGGWGNKHDIEGFYAGGTFYNQTLPTKYMQHFEILDWNDNGTTGHVKFTDGLEVKRENGMINMYQDGHLIAETKQNTINDRGIGETKLFIPWTWKQLSEEAENKVYHWNPDGGESTWNIPKNFAGAQTVKVYELSDEGRTFVKEVEVKENKVTIDAKANTPYVIYTDTVDESRIDTWGEGTLIKNPGFDATNISDNWKLESSTQKTDHIKKVNETFDGRNGNDILIVDGKDDATISQEITGLIPGKTYSASVWTKLEGDRKVTLGVEAGKEISTTYIDKKTTRINAGQGVKFGRDSATRMRVEFTVPEGVTTAKLYLKADGDEDASKVLVDDFRIWTNPLENVEPTNRDGYVIYEDFENVDEGHGPFYMSSNLKTDTRTHYAENDPEKDQYMNWTIDGRFSLKTNQQAGSTGEILVTDQTTMKLKPNTKYELGFKYTNKLEDLYSIGIKSPQGGSLFEEKLVPGKVVGVPEDGPGYSREVKEFKKEFTTENFDDYYLTLMKGNNYDELVIDNLYVKEIKDETEKPEIKPEKVGNLSEAEVTDSTVKLTWTEPENAKVTGYTIYKDGKEFAKTENEEFVIENLKENTIYGFKVVANGVGTYKSKPASISVRTKKVEVKAQENIGKNVAQQEAKEKGFFESIKQSVIKLFN